MATPKKTRAPKVLRGAPAPVPEAPLEAMDFLAFINQNLAARNYTDLRVRLEGFDGVFTLDLQGVNVNSAIIATSLKFTREDAPRACFQAVAALDGASAYADHQNVQTPDFQP